MHRHCMVSTTSSKCDRPWQQHTLPGKSWLVTWQHRPRLTQHRNLHLSTLAPFPSTPKSLPPLWKCIPWCAGNTGANIPCPAVNQVTLTGFTLYFIYHLISVQQNEMQGFFLANRSSVSCEPLFPCIICQRVQRQKGFQLCTKRNHWIPSSRFVRLRNRDCICGKC